MYTQIAAFLKTHCESQGWDPPGAGLARALADVGQPVSRQRVSMWLTGERRPEADLWPALAKALRLSVDQWTEMLAVMGLAYDAPGEKPEAAA